MTPWPHMPTLEDAFVRLDLLSHDHADDLSACVRAGELDLLWYTSIPSSDDMANEIDRRLGLRAQGSMLPFAVIDKKTGRAVGMTTYMNIDPVNRRVEIGSTWYAKSVQRSGLNTACKMLLLSHAFDDLECIAVEFRTHSMNRQSRNAIERLGAKLDGVMRAHTRMKNGTLRDTAVYSITAAEWPAVKANLEWQMAKPR